MSMEPWRLPGDAFPTIDNAYLRSGVITKRLGYTEFAQMEHWSAQDFTKYDETDVQADRVSVAAGTIEVTDLDSDEEVYVSNDFGVDYFDDDTDPWIFEFEFNCSDGGGYCGLWGLSQDLDTITALQDGDKNFISLIMESDNKIYLDIFHEGESDSDGTDSAVAVDDTPYYVTVTVSHSAGTVTAGIYTNEDRTTEFDTLTVLMPDSTDYYQYLYWMQGLEAGAGGVTWDGDIVNARIVTKPGYPIMGLFQFKQVSGASDLVVMDTKRLGVLNTSNERIEDVTGSDTFTGSDENFFSATTMNDELYFINEVDALYSWNGTDVAQVTVDISDDLANDLGYAKAIAYYKSRLVLLNTEEDGTSYPQRVRFSAAGTDDFTGDEYVDLPTADAITGCMFLGDNLIITCAASTWFLQYTGDSTQPFIPRRISDKYGGVNAQSPTDLNDIILNFSGVSIVACDGTKVEKVLQKAAELTIGADQGKLAYCQGQRVEELDQAWITYPESGESYCNKVFVYNFVEGSVSTYSLDDLHCYGTYTLQDDPSWDDLDVDWNDYEASWDSAFTAEGFPLIFAGSFDGWLHRMQYGVTDNGTEYDMVLESSKMNPFYQDGRQARFGYLDILTEVDASVELEIDFYKDHATTPYKSVTVTCSSTGTEDRKWFRIPVNETGSFHKFELTHSGSQELRIFAFMPWFKPAGRVV